MKAPFRIAMVSVLLALAISAPLLAAEGPVEGASGPKDVPREGQGGSIFIDVPVARGVDVYLFAGPTIRQAVARYNLYSGGGFLPDSSRHSRISRRK